MPVYRTDWLHSYVGVAKEAPTPEGTRGVMRALEKLRQVPSNTYTAAPSSLATPRAAGREGQLRVQAV